MNVKVALADPVTPPETGASTNVICLILASSCNYFTAFGRIVEESIIKLPFFKLLKRPSFP